MDSVTWIGIATSVKPKLRTIAGGKRVRRPAQQYVRITQAAAKQYGARVCLFDPHSVDWNNGTIDAWTPQDPQHPERDWVNRSVRLPDVIYENVFVHLAVQGYVSELRRQAAKRNIPLYNPILPGKWRMISVLKAAGLADYTPTTERLSSAAQVRDRLRKWGTIYVKPIGGYGGLNVHRIERQPDGTYRMSVDRTKSATRHKRTIMTAEELDKWTHAHRSGYLLQRGLHLMTVGGRKVDFRVVLHRDRHGEWQLVGIVPKLAATDGVVTNVIAGGERSDVKAFEQAAAREGKQVPWAALERRAKEIAAVLSKRHPSVGLVGFDMGVEDDGTISMIEMNPKPARSLLNRPMLEIGGVHGGARGVSGQAEAVTLGQVMVEAGENCSLATDRPLQVSAQPDACPIPPRSYARNA